MQERGKHKASVFTSVVCIVRYKKNLLALVMLTGSKKGITWISTPPNQEQRYLSGLSLPNSPLVK